jgi:ketosteroid isomerase-like protein
MSRELLERFYSAFARRDGEAMAACYADDVVFTDPVFVDLRGERARDMWRMLTARAKDLELTYEVKSASDTGGVVHWEATYTFSTTRRRVHNVIDAKLEVAGGKIQKHTDVFDFWRWSRQALGAPGLLLGWSSLLQNKVRETAQKGLDDFRKTRVESELMRPEGPRRDDVLRAAR